MLLERLLDLLEMRQETDVVRDLRRRLRDTGERRETGVIRFAGVGLAADAVHLLEAHPLGDPLVQRVDLRVVALEEVEEGGLGARRPADTEEAERVDAELELLEVEQQILEPERCALAYGR